MSSIIDDKIFELVTKPENFDFAWDVAERFDDIKRQLWTNFFERIKEELLQLYPNYYLSDDKDWRFFCISSTKWTKTKLCFSIEGSPFKYGIQLSLSGKKKLDSVFSDFLDLTFSDIEPISNKGINRYYIVCEDKLETLRGIKILLPSNLDNTIAEYISEFKTFHEKMIVELDKFEQNA